MAVATWDQSNPPIFWDNSQAWDSQQAAPVNSTNKMITLRTSLAGLKSTTQLEEHRKVELGLTTHAADFPNLPVPLATYSAKVDALDTNLMAIGTAEQDLKALRLARPTLLAEAQLMYSRNAVAVMGTCGDDAAKAVTSGYELASEAAPVAALVLVAALAVTTGDHTGELDKQHNPVPGAASYETQVSDNPNTGWTHYSTTSTSTETLTNQPSMTMRWVRVRAIRGEDDKGPWSDPATGLVP